MMDMIWDPMPYDLCKTDNVENLLMISQMKADFQALEVAGVVFSFISSGF